MVQVLSTLAGGNANLTAKVEESAMQMAKQGALTALKLAKISAGEFVDAMGTMPEQDSMICRLLDILGRGVLKELFGRSKVCLLELELGQISGFTCASNES